MRESDGLAGEVVLFGPYPAEAMTAHPVSTLVNKPADDAERCVEPVDGGTTSTNFQSSQFVGPTERESRAPKAH